MNLLPLQFKIKKCHILYVLSITLSLNSSLNGKLNLIHFEKLSHNSAFTLPHSLHHYLAKPWVTPGF